MRKKDTHAVVAEEILNVAATDIGRELSYVDPS